MQFKEPTDVWQRLANADKPIVMYGTGNGADKLFRVFSEYGIAVDDIFVSDAFYRGQTFRGYTCLTYQQVCEKYDDCIVVLAFAIFREDMMSFIKEVQTRFEVLAPEVPVFGTDYFTYADLAQWEENIHTVYSLLADQTSKDVFRDLMEYRISGKIDYLFSCETPREEVFQNIFSFGTEESYVDLGAYRGDTLEEFLQLTQGLFSKAYALEPDEKNYKKLLEYAETLPPDVRSKLEFYNLASWSHQTELAFDGGGGRNSSLNTGTRTVRTTDVDSILNGRPATYLKMDVEGAEAETLDGLAYTLKNYRPKLAVSAYHRTRDLLTLPQKICASNPDYEIYLRHHPYLPAWETNFYCK